MKTGAYLTLLAGLGGVVAGGHAQDGTSEEHFQFREPQPVSYVLEPPRAAKQAGGRPAWVRVRPAHGPARAAALGSRVVLRLASPNDLSQLLAGSALELCQVAASNLFLLQAPDALTAAREAQRLAAAPGVEVCHPVRRRPVRLHGGFAPVPNDAYYYQQWHLENLDPGAPAPVADLNVRAAWLWTRGEGVIIAQGDDGVEPSHPDLQPNLDAAYHYDFVNNAPSGAPSSTFQKHGTSVAGLLSAAANNQRGVCGVAPGARLASWVVFDALDALVDEQATAEMFQFHSNLVAVQNHSWGNADILQLSLGALESAAIGNAVERGRGGLGAVLVRSAGNNREWFNDGNDDGYAQDPRTIAVGAVRSSGRATSYSTPGANVLVAALSGDHNVDTADGGVTNYPGLVTTDRLGSNGYNELVTGDDFADYNFGDPLFDGTSGACPQVAGVVALILAANPRLGYRDVQQILIFSARQTDPADPDLRTNQAGLRVSHGAGFGVPDAGQAVALARAWRNRPAPVSLSVTNNTAAAIPDDGLRVIVTGTGVPPGLESIPASPTDGLQLDDPTPAWAVVDAGQALGPIAADLTGKAALIQRGQNYFVEKVTHAANAHARLAILYNNSGDERLFVNGADFQFLPIPSVFLGQTAGEALRTYLQQTPDARAQVSLQAVRLPLLVTNTLLCEHVALRVQCSHPRRADVRITLVSPAGTRSVLHHYNADTASALGDWTYYSTHHFYESSAGLWQAEISDEQPGQTGSVSSVILTLQGVPITDTDHDGLDDDWERAALHTLEYGPQEDNDGDGANNMREQMAGTDPLAVEVPFRVEVSALDPERVRLSWPALPSYSYQVYAGSDVHLPLTLEATLAGRFPELEWLVYASDFEQQFYRVKQVPAGPK